jgi:hypothetical protein
MAEALRGAMAVYEDGEWVAAQQSVLAMFGDEQDEFLEQWPHAGATRGRSAHSRDRAHRLRILGGSYWPTPAACLPNDEEAPERWLVRWLHNLTKDTGTRTNAGVPLAVAWKAPVVLTVANRRTIPEAREFLERHEREPRVELQSEEHHPAEFVEALMGFPEGWTDLR